MATENPRGFSIATWQRVLPRELVGFPNCGWWPGPPSREILSMLKIDLTWSNNSWDTARELVKNPKAWGPGSLKFLSCTHVKFMICAKMPQRLTFHHKSLFFDRVWSRGNGLLRLGRQVSGRKPGICGVERPHDSGVPVLLDGGMAWLVEGG